MEARLIALEKAVQALVEKVNAQVQKQNAELKAQAQTQNAALQAHSQKLDAEMQALKAQVQKQNAELKAQAQTQNAALQAHSQKLDAELKAQARNNALVQTSLRNLEACIFPLWERTFVKAVEFIMCCFVLCYDQQTGEVRTFHVGLTEVFRFGLSTVKKARFRDELSQSLGPKYLSSIVDANLQYLTERWKSAKAGSLIVRDKDTDETLEASVKADVRKKTAFEESESLFDSLYHLRENGNIDAHTLPSWDVLEVLLDRHFPKESPACPDASTSMTGSSSAASESVPPLKLSYAAAAASGRPTTSSIQKHVKRERITTCSWCTLSSVGCVICAQTLTCYMSCTFMEHQH
jgi:hypothetical protein